MQSIKVLKLLRYEEENCSYTIIEIHESKSVLCFCNLLNDETDHGVFGVHTCSYLDSNVFLGFLKGKGILK